MAMALQKEINKAHSPLSYKPGKEGGPTTLLRLFIPIVFTILLNVPPAQINAAGNGNDSVYIGYADDNRDGVNDLFSDADGNGVNDITGERLFDVKFVDADDDGINDIFTDLDGDGVNDIYMLSGMIPVVDMDNDMKNDITGIYYCSGNYRGFMTGKCIEETGTVEDNYSDNNGNFTDDEIEGRIYEFMHDRFIDEDKDGICDGRENKLSPQKKRGNK